MVVIICWLFYNTFQNICIAYKGRNIAGFRMIIYFIWCSDLLKASVVHHCDRVRHIDGFFLIVGNVNKCNSKLLLQMLQLMLHGSPQLQIQCTQRLVQKKDFRVIHQCPGNRYSLPLAAGKFRWLSFLKSCKLHKLQHFFYSAADLGFWRFL